MILTMTITIISLQPCLQELEILTEVVKVRALGAVFHHPPSQSVTSERMGFRVSRAGINRGWFEHILRVYYLKSLYIPYTIIVKKFCKTTESTLVKT